MKIFWCDADKCVLQKGFWCDAGSKLAEILSHWSYELEATKKVKKMIQKLVRRRKRQD